MKDTGLEAPVSKPRLVFLTVVATLAAVLTAPRAHANDPSRVEIPLFLDYEDAGLVTIVPGEPIETTLIEGSDLFQALLPVATPQVQTRLWNAIQNGFISITDLRPIGIDIRFDMETLTLQATLPPEARKPKDISLRYGSSSKLTPEKRAKTSFAVNAYGSRSLWHENPGEDVGANGIRGDFDGFVSLPFEAVLEAEGGYSEYAPNRWSRGDIRAVYDFTPHLLRFTAGDLRFPTTGFRSYIPLGGFGVSRELSIDPDLVSYPTSSTRVQIRHPSRVDILVNGTLLRTLRLPAGQFDIREIPLLGRSNEVELIITDVFGRVERVRFPFLSANELLRPGLHQFSYDVGLPSTPEAGRYEYDQERPTVSASHRAGITNRLTLGAFAQGNKDQATAGLEAVTINRLGLFRLDGAFSHLNNRTYPSSGAGRLAYRSLGEGQNDEAYSWGLQYEARGRSFAQLGELAPSNRVRGRLEGFVNIRLSPGATSTVGAFHNQGHTGFESTKGAYVNTSVSLSNDWLLGLDLSANDDPQTNRERRAFVSLRWRDSLRPLAAALSADTRDSTQRLEFAYSGNQTRADISATQAQSSDSLNANLATLLPRAQLGYGLTTTATDITTGSSRNTVSLFQFAAALAYADGALTISRPIAESFALVGNRREPWQRGIVVNPSESAYASRIGALGPAPIVDLSSYRPREIIIDTTPLQTGLSLMRERFLVIPGYRSGYHLPLKVRSIVVVQGRLLLPDGKPASLISGEIRPEIRPEREERSDMNGAGLSAREFFTDRDGRFEADGLNPGKHRLTLYSDEYAPLIFMVEVGAKGTITLGDLTMKHITESHATEKEGK